MWVSTRLGGCRQGCQNGEGGTEVEVSREVPLLKFSLNIFTIIILLILILIVYYFRAQHARLILSNIYFFSLGAQLY